MYRRQLEPRDCRKLAERSEECWTKCQQMINNFHHDLQLACACYFESFLYFNHVCVQSIVNYSLSFQCCYFVLLPSLSLSRNVYSHCNCLVITIIHAVIDKWSKHRNSLNRRMRKMRSFFCWANDDDLYVGHCVAWYYCDWCTRECNKIVQPFIQNLNIQGKTRPLSLYA